MADITLDEWLTKLEKLGKDGLIDAYFCLAVMYLIGQGVEKDIKYAYMWVLLLVRMGMRMGAEAIELLEKK